MKGLANAAVFQWIKAQGVVASSLASRPAACCWRGRQQRQEAQQEKLFFVAFYDFNNSTRKLNFIFST